MASIKVAKDVSRVGYHEVSLWNLKVSLDVILFLFHAVKCCSTCQLFYVSDFVHLQLRHRAAKSEDAKNARVFLFLIWDVHVVHRPTDLDYFDYIGFQKICGCYSQEFSSSSYGMFM